MTKSSKQYRPYFTPEELITIHTSLTATNTSASLKIAKKLDLIIFKIRSESLTPSIISTRQSIEEKLGFDEDDTDKPTIQANLIRTPEECYNLSITGSFNLLSSAELEKVRQYRYENDLMSDEEEELFEKELGIR